MADYVTPAEARLAIGDSALRDLVGKDASSGGEETLLASWITRSTSRINSGLRVAGYPAPVDFSAIADTTLRAQAQGLLRARCIDGVLDEARQTAKGGMGNSGGKGSWTEAGERLQVWLQDLAGAPGTNGSGKVVYGVAPRQSIPGLARSAP